MRARGSTRDLFAPLPVPPAPRTPPRPAPEPAAAPESRQLWLCARLPELALAAVGDTRDARAVIEGVDRRQIVVAANAAATAHGIGAGLGLNAAYALCPTLITQPRNARAEEYLLHALARRATCYTPVVCLAPPDELLLEIRASRRLFGGLDSLVARFSAELTGLGHALKVGLAPTAQAARWLARAGNHSVASPALLASRLSTLPIACTRWPPDVQETLARFGVSRLGELNRLPRDGLARRCPALVLDELDAAYGRRPAPHAPYLAPERFHQRLDFDEPVEALAELNPALDRLLDSLERYLTVRAAAVGSITFSFEHRGQRATRAPLARSSAAQAAGDWRRLLQERLIRLTLPAPVVAVRLRSGVVTSAESTSGTLPGIPDATLVKAAAGALLDRLRARLGEAAVSGLCLVPEHRPEAAVRRVVPQTALSREPISLPGAPRPLWLLNQPEPLALRARLPWYHGSLALESGPERIESGWWDGGDVRRDYYVAATEEGVRLWIYRTHRRWFLHGVFA
jgi:protein ImuB